jgi:hypothetical protein
MLLMCTMNLFLHGLERTAGLHQASIANVGEHAGMAFGRYACEIQHLLAGDAGRILCTAADADRTFVEARLEHGEKPFVGFHRYRLMNEFIECRITDDVIKRFAGDFRLAHFAAPLQREAHTVVADAGAVVDELVSGLLLVPGLHRVDADFQFQACGDAVLGLIGSGLVAVGVRMEIDEPRCGDQVASFDHAPAAQ